MARYIHVDVRISNDDKIRQLIPAMPSAYALFFFLLCNHRNTGIPGLYSAGRQALAEELGWELCDFDRCFQQLVNLGLVTADWKNRVILIHNCLKYNPPSATSIIIHWARMVDEMPECDLVRQAVTVLLEVVKGKGQAFLNAFIESFPKFNSSGQQTIPPSEPSHVTQSEFVIPPAVQVQLQIQPQGQLQESNRDDANQKPLKDVAAELAGEFWELIPGKRKQSISEFIAHFESKLKTLFANGRDETDRIRKCIHDPKRDPGDVNNTNKLFLFWQYCGFEIKRATNGRKKSKGNSRTAPGGGRYEGLEVPNV